MKKNLFYLFILMAVVAMPLTSCENKEPQTEEESQHDPVADDDQMAFVGYSSLEWLQGNIVIVDENNEVIRRVYGKPLDESMPTVVSVPVADYADAEKIFLSWVAPTKEATKVDGGYDYNLTDASGNAEGGVSFRAVEGGAGVIARMSIAEGTALKQVSEVNFIDAELWPENAEYPVYEAGKTYWLPGERYEWLKYPREINGKVYDCKIIKENLEFYCVQGNNNGSNAILVWLSPDRGGTLEFHNYFGKCELYVNQIPERYLEAGLNKRLSSLVEALEIFEFYNNNYDAWENMLEVMDEKGYRWSAAGFLEGGTGNSEFLFATNSTLYFPCLDLDDDQAEIVTVDIDSSYKYRYMHVRIVPAR